MRTGERRAVLERARAAGRGAAAAGAGAAAGATPAAVLLLVLTSVMPSAASAQPAPPPSGAAAPASRAIECASGFPGGSRATSAGYTIAWRADPQKIPVGRHFAIDLLVCPKAGAAGAAGAGTAPGSPAAVPVAVAVDARMPSHGHGMNYKPTLKPVGENRYRAEGLMFHMPGQWELVFDLRSGDKVERATQAVTVR